MRGLGDKIVEKPSDTMINAVKKHIGKELVKKHAETMIEAMRQKDKGKENDLLGVANKNNTPFMSQANKDNLDEQDGPKTALQRFMEKQA